MRVVDVATTASRTLGGCTHSRRPGSSHESAGPRTPRIVIARNLVFGSGFLPTVETFFASWLSEAETIARVGPAFSDGASRGSGNSASPEIGSNDAAPTSTRR